MKTRQAKKIAAAVAAGVQFPIHIMRAASLQLNLPLCLPTQVGEITFYPRGLKGEFVRATKYRPYRDYILPKLSVKKGEYNYVHDLNADPGRNTLDVSCGCSIDGTCRVALNAARKLGVVIDFTFNDIPVKVRPSSRLIDLYDGWVAEGNRRRAEYYKSDKYKAYKAKEDADYARDQAIIDRLMLELDAAVGNRDTILNWLSEFAAVADNIHMNYSKLEVLNKLYAGGWKSDVWTTKSDDPAEKKAMQNAIASSKQIEAEYIVGQAISCLEGGMPPHPVLISFVKRYHGEKDEPVVNEYDDESVEAEAVTV